MRCRALLWIVILLPMSCYALTVYKAESEEGVIVLQDRPIKGVDRQETIQLKQAHLHHNPQQSASRPSAMAEPDHKRALEIKRQQLLSQIHAARIELENAATLFTKAQLQKRFQQRECRSRTYRMPSDHSANNYAACQPYDTAEQSRQLQQAQLRLSRLRQDYNRLG